ncbi:MAG TPA: trehalose-phosphatase [Anaerolineales bacterium]|nr:trehalose-phosphatase [Anaerolineales bacterium]
MTLLPANDLIHQLKGKRVDLFLDYDGTLAVFAPTPDDVLPNDDVIGLISQLADLTNVRVSIVSGRRLAHIRKLLPIKGILLAGTYGVEMQKPDGEEIHQMEYESIRPTLDSLKPRWQELINDKLGFYLEDKGWALAIHARNAEEQQGLRVLEEAEKMLTPNVLGEHLQKIHSYRFLEIGPNNADKGHALRYLFDNFHWTDSIPIYIGDDDKDEEAFQVINEKNGFSILVSKEERTTKASYRLSSPTEVHQWLRDAFIVTK